MKATLFPAVVLLALLAPACAGKKEPIATADARDYSETGLASWYGKKYHGRTTANGEQFDMHAMTAAHRRLPFGTMLRVTNLENGRKIEVRINDRGPFVKGRIIDLSYGAARKLGMVDAGVVRVRIRAVGS